MWDNLTIQQYQKVVDIIDASPKDATDIDIESEIISYLEDINVNELSINEFKEYRAKYKFLHATPPKYSPANTFKVGKVKYGVIYDVSQVRYGMYNEVIKFSEKQQLIKNLHKIMASIVVPMKRTWLGAWVVDPKKYSHNKVADDMLQAPFIVAYNAAVFFYQLFRGYLMITKESYLQKLMEVKKMSREQAETTYQLLMSNMDGFTMPKS